MIKAPLVVVGAVACVLAVVFVVLLGVAIRGSDVRGVTSYSNRWDVCISGEALVINLDESMPTLQEAQAAVAACWAAASKGEPAEGGL